MTCSPSLKARLEASSIDWRTDPLLLLFNRLAHGVMQRAAIPVIDTWGLTTVLMDLTGDGIHFAERGVVGRGVQQVVAHTLCAARDGGGSGSAAAAAAARSAAAASGRAAGKGRRRHAEKGRLMGA